MKVAAILGFALVLAPSLVCGGTITPTVDTPLQFKATGGGVFPLGGSDTAEILGPNWRFTLRFLANASGVSNPIFIFQHVAFAGSEGISEHINSAGGPWPPPGTPPTAFPFEYTLSTAHPISGNRDSI